MYLAGSKGFLSNDKGRHRYVLRIQNVARIITTGRWRCLYLSNCAPKWFLVRSADHGTGEYLSTKPALGLIIAIAPAAGVGP